jgi:hypothetical protein
MKTLLLTLVLIAAASAAKGPWFCHDLDCPVYRLVDKKDGYEIRKYEATKWAGVTIESTSYTKAANDAFEMLFKYISGANSASEKIPMAAPVATQIKPPCTVERCMTNYTVLFFTPFAFQANTPAPTDAQLKLVDLPAITAYVSQFGGYETDEILMKETKALKEKVEKDGLNYLKDYYFTADYDPPFRVLERHNEVWLIATD